MEKKLIGILPGLTKVVLGVWGGEATVGGVHCIRGGDRGSRDGWRSKGLGVGDWGGDGRVVGGHRVRRGKWSHWGGQWSGNGDWSWGSKSNWSWSGHGNWSWSSENS